MPELLIHAGHNEHRVVGALLAPRTYWADGRRPISRLVVDAITAMGQDEFAEVASEHGVPFLVDPLTSPLAYGAHETNPWLRLPYATEAAVPVRRLRNASARRQLVESVVDTQLGLGASMVVPPYFYAHDASDPWFELNRAFLVDTARYVAGTHPGLGLFPVFCGRLDKFGRASDWPTGVDKFTAMAREVGAEIVGISLSPLGTSKSDKYDKTLRYFQTMIHAQRSGLRVIAWKQGVFGPGVAAVGAAGYSTGMGKLEATKAADEAARRKRAPSDRKSGKGGYGYKGVYFEVLGHSVPHRAGEILMANQRLRPSIMCSDEGCCPSWSQTLENPLEHAVRTRARQLVELGQQPHPPWRLTNIVRQAETAANVAKQANQVLEAAGESFRVKLAPLESLRDVAEHLRRDWPTSAIA